MKVMIHIYLFLGMIAFAIWAGLTFKKYQNWLEKDAPCYEWTAASDDRVPARCEEYFKTHFKFDIDNQRLSNYYL